MSRWPGAPVLALFAVVLLGSSAGAQVVPPPIVFLDDRPLTVELASTTTSFKVDIRNAGTADQAPKLRVVDARSAKNALTGLDVKDEVTPSPLAPGANAVANVTLTASQGPAAGTYEGRLIVHGDSGPASSRTITIVVPAATTQTSVPSGPAVDAGLETYTVAQPSYWPSLTRHWPQPGAGLAFVIPTILLVGAVVLWRWAGHPATTPAGVFLAAVGLVLASSWLFPRAGDLKAAEWGLVIVAAGLIAGAVVVAPHRARPVDTVVAVLLFAVTVGAVALANAHTRQPVPSHTVASPGPAATGSLVHPDGTPARLQRADNELRITGLRRAGAYKGAIDLDPATDKGNLKVTVNVRDWFGFAIISLGLGLLLATSLADWFKNGRARSKAHLALAEAAEGVGLVLRRASQPGPGPAPPPPPGFKAVTERLIARVRQSLATDRVDEATTRIKELTDYASAYEALLTARKQLAADVEAVKGLAAGIPQGALADAELRLQQPEDLSDDTEKRERLTSLADVTKTDAMAIDALLLALTPVPERWQWINHVDTKNWTDPDRTTFATNVEAFERAVDALLGARGDANIKTAATAVDTAFATVRAHAEAPKQPRGVPDMVTVDDLELFKVTGQWGADYLLVDVSPPPPTVVIGAIALRRLGSPEPAGDPAPGEPLVLSVDVSVQGDQPLSLRYWWTFGDGSSSQEEHETLAAGGAKRLEQVHQFLAAGEVTTVFNARIAGQTDPLEPRVLVIRLDDASATARARRAFVRDDRVMAAIAGVIAIGSGLVALYFNTADWGSAEHYLKAFVWGGLVSEGTKAVKGIAERALPS